MNLFPTAIAVQFAHTPALWQTFPELVAGCIHVDGLHDQASVQPAHARYIDIAKSKLRAGAESDLPAIQAWRRAFARMGLKPTQYRCAAEALLRRLRKEGNLPPLHRLVDLCNAMSVAYAIPIAVFDLARVAGNLQVRHASGDEDYLAFSGEHERPDAGEVIFADDSRQVHARRWCNRQSALSAIRPATTQALIVAEAMHETAAHDVAELLDALTGELRSLWGARVRTAVLAKDAPVFDSAG
jgi:DNA/RNA-binding domain of Phe-tRNA-synthetase-like protein